MAGVAVIRISGERAEDCLRRLTDKPLPGPRRAVLRRLLDGDGSALDEALVLRFDAGASYTGEAVAELHCHGGPALVRRVLERLSQFDRCRLAVPGEFTRRAFESGRMDLAEIEALGDLLAAETEAQRRRAMRGMDGALHRRADSWRESLLHALTLVEVTIDWAEEDVPEDVGPKVAELLGSVLADVKRELEMSDAARRLRLGYEVALVGPPNSGKSSLINYLAGREAALTSPVPGTTRDVIELRYDLRGLPVIFLDMAGIRTAEDEVEALGIDRAKERASGADLRLFLQSPGAPDPMALSDLWMAGDLHVHTMADLEPSVGGMAVSTVSGQGFEALLGGIEEALQSRGGESGLVAHMRQREALELTAAYLGSAQSGALPAEELAEELRAALSALDAMVGQTGPEDVLDRVFANYCLGK